MIGPRLDDNIPGLLRVSERRCSRALYRLDVIGPGLEQVIAASENFEAVDALRRAVLTGCTLLGRLGIFTALALLSPAVRKSS